MYLYVYVWKYTCVCIINCYNHSMKWALLLVHFTGEGSETDMQKPCILTQVENGRARIQSN